ncbi:MAG: hypothetical protein VKK04_24135 [Synechococcales bacterium]|nr:hypothetical protein [Synechococcales bacterium]
MTRPRPSPGSVQPRTARQRLLIAGVSGWMLLVVCAWVAIVALAKPNAMSPTTASTPDPVPLTSDVALDREPAPRPAAIPVANTADSRSSLPSLALMILLCVLGCGMLSQRSRSLPPPRR